MVKLPFGLDINNLIDDLRIFSWEAADVLLNYSQLIKDKTFKSKIENNIEIKTKMNNLIDKINIIQNNLYQTKNRSRQDPLNYPIKLNNKLAHLSSVASNGNYKPTDQMIEVKNLINEEELKIASKLLKDPINKGIAYLSNAQKKKNLD